MSSILKPNEVQASLEQVVLAPDFAMQVSGITEQLSETLDPASAIDLLNKAVDVVGADNGFFVSFVRDDDSCESFRFMLACDPRWCFAYEKDNRFATHPWLLYAMRHTEPIRASEIPVRRADHRRIGELATSFGFASALVVPAQSPGTLSRLGVLVLGSNSPSRFEGQGYFALKMAARCLAMEFHEWWVRQARAELIHNARINEGELELLRMERSQLGTKEIASALDLSPIAVDSRFQRLNSKLAAPNRKAAARIAAEYGLI
jgi:DNA-binding CsgD family transcriptional regulator